MPQYLDWSRATTRTRIRLAQDFVRDYPHIVAFYFHRRFQLFQKTVVFPKYNVIDYWDRYEWQGRGSTHNHGLYYCQGYPNPDHELSLNAVPTAKAQLAKYWGHYITAIHPDPNPQELAEEGSALSLLFSEMTFKFQELSSILTRCYMHRCMSSYCLRKDKNTGAEVCRFNAPWALSKIPSFEKPIAKPYYRFLAKRNNQRLNAYSPLLVLGWRANTDIQVCTSTTGVVQYMGVYASKGESQTQTLKDLAIQVLTYISPTRPLVSLAAKFINKVISERDYSSQEVFHHLFQLPFHNCSRVVVTVDCRPTVEQSTAFIFQQHSAFDALPEDPSFESGQSLFQKYKARSSGLSSVCYLDFLLHFTHQKPFKRRPRAKARILNYFPRYSPSTHPEDFARVKLWLHHPFIDEESVTLVSGILFSTYSEAYAHCQKVCTHELSDAYGTEAPGVEEDDPNLEELPTDLDSSLDELANRRPGSQGEEVDEDDLGVRPIDRLKDWTLAPHIDTFALDPATYWDTLKRIHPVQVSLAPIGTNTGTNTSPDASTAAIPVPTPPPLPVLHEQQQVLVSLFVNHFAARLRGEDVPPLLVNLDGQGGTGKTFVIETLSRLLDQQASDTGSQHSPIIRCAPTGVAAYLISGKTINTIFRIPISKSAQPLEPLSATGRQSIQATFAGVHYLVIDEKSMVSLTMLSWIHSRCCEIWPHQGNLLFGGLSIILSGDFYQLPPVGRRPLYDLSPGRSLLEAHGRQLYQAFNKTVVLTTVMRQQGEEQAAFRVALQNLRKGCSTPADWALLMTQCRSSVSEQVFLSFQSSVRLCGTRHEVQARNNQCLKDTQCPVLIINAQHDNVLGASVSTEDGGNLPCVLKLSIGSKIMLLQNIWTERGLVNGATGVVVNIVWGPTNTRPNTTPPLAVLVAVDDYTGPGLFQDSNNRPVIPVFPLSRSFYFNNISLTRTQFPLQLAWAITIHKSQGLTLEQAVICVNGPRDFVPGLLYVAVSRVKSLSGLLFDQPLSLERLKGRPTATSERRYQDELRRSRELVTVADTEF
jgi:ATP-dependent DNA helicase PIF1